jgi:hypothetical protein
MWKGSSRSLFQTLILENSKFIMFVVTPIVTAGIFSQDAWVERIVANRQYIIYPPEGDKPPTNPNELQEKLRERGFAPRREA